MNSLLQRLARDGDISWLSYYFAEFISQRDASSMDALPALSAALVSEANLAGDVCVDLEQFHGRALFIGSRVEAGDIATGPAPDEWRAALLSSPCISDGDQPAPMVVAGTRLYLARYWHYENCVAAIINAMLAHAPIANTAQIDTEATTLFADQPGIDADQLGAVRAAASRAFSVISGGPGSGKTSTVVRILALLLARDRDCRIALAAPTGKAAARMMDSIRERLDALDLGAEIKAAIPLEARTLHRLLGYRQHTFSYHAGRRLPVDCVVIDEASMIDLKMMYQLLVALPDSAQLILLGDRDQLASVAAGNVLGDITGHGHRIEDSGLPIATAISLLSSSYRFGRDSAIGELAQRVRRGDAKAASELLRTEASGLHWNELSPADDTEDPVGDMAMRWIRRAYLPIFDCETPAEALDVYQRSRLLCVTNRGSLGVDSLNDRISASMLAHTGQGGVATHFHGLPIMITRNLHDLGLFNGDAGILWQIDGELRACFRADSGDVRDLAVNRLSDFKPAWAITVHKSQGSEFDSVLLLLPADAQSELLSRELLYTGITRARREFMLQASEAALTRAVTHITRRYSGLASKLGWPTGEPG